MFSLSCPILLSHTKVQLSRTRRLRWNVRVVKAVVSIDRGLWSGLSRHLRRCLTWCRTCTCVETSGWGMFMGGNVRCPVAYCFVIFVQPVLRFFATVFTLRLSIWFLRVYGHAPPQDNKLLQQTALGQNPLLPVKRVHRRGMRGVCRKSWFVRTPIPTAFHSIRLISVRTSKDVNI